MERQRLTVLQIPATEGRTLSASFKVLGSPVRQLLAGLLDLLVWDDVGQVGQVDQLLHERRRIPPQEGQDLVPPRWRGPPVPPLPPRRIHVSEARQQVLEEVLVEDQAVPPAGL